MAAALTIVIATPACGKVADKVSERAAEEAAEAAAGGDAEVDLDPDGGSIAIETEDGSISGGVGEVPADWPDDVPLPDGLEVGLGSSVDDPSTGPIHSVTGTAPASPAEIVALYEDALAGWEVTSQLDTTVDDTVSATRTFEHDGRAVDLIASSGETGTTVTVTHRQG